jgi:WXG100 family type VII secretion target
VDKAPFRRADRELDPDRSDRRIKEGVMADDHMPGNPNSGSQDPAGSGGQNIPGSAAFGVNLQALSDAIATVHREKDNISGTLEQIEMRMRNLNGYWHGPAHDSFDPVRKWYNNATTDLMDILDEIILRMQKSYDNYHQAESQNLQNLTPTSSSTSTV